LDFLAAACLVHDELLDLLGGAGWGFHEQFKLGFVRSWGKCPHNEISYGDNDFWLFVADQVDEQEADQVGNQSWSGITGWSWDGDRGLLLVEREDIDPPRRFVITPMPKDWK
jgi:hypothetical protein